MKFPLRAAVVSLGVLLAGSSMMPVEAMPLAKPQVSAASDVQVVRDRKKVKIWRHGRNVRNFHNRGWRGHRNFSHYRVWRGHRGYRYHRPGYRLYGGYWYPPAAFRVVIRPGRHVRGNAHVRWCYNHYRSYRASDNTFQPYNGPRQQCVSP